MQGFSLPAPTPLGVGAAGWVFALLTCRAKTNG